MAKVNEAPATTKQRASHEELTGMTVIARSLKQQGVNYMFGVVGFPVFGIAQVAQAEGIQYIGCRNEQAASYAACAIGYLTGRPGACLAVPGPGMIHALAGFSNAWANNWPMILLGGSIDTFQDGQGAFQEAPQLEAARPFAKYAARPSSIERLPYYIEKAVRTSMYGRPGPVYIDLPNDIIMGKVPAAGVEFKPGCPDAPRPLAEPAAVKNALKVLQSAERPLVIVGKGAAYARAENEVREFLERTKLPFLPSPMGKGVVPDDHPLSAAPARSYALEHADVIFLMGARLNWILHFGLPPRFAKDVRIIQMDLAGEEIGNNVPTEVALMGDAKSITGQLNDALGDTPWSYPEATEWRTALKAYVEGNLKAFEELLNDDSEPLGYYRVLREVRDQLPRDAIVVNEGANTMDIGRVVIPNYEPRQRLDAGTFATMGLGLGYALAAAVVHPNQKVVAIEGDSAFGFSGMEVEVACRYKLPITFVIVNNNGIMSGFSEIDYERGVPPSALTVNAHYERIIEAFGGKGHFVTKAAELAPTLKEAFADPSPNIVNIMINPKSQRRPQKFHWFTT